MRKAKNIVMGFLALLPVLWVLLTCTTGFMAARAEIDTYSFGQVSVQEGVIAYTNASPAKLILSSFIPAGIAPDDLGGATGAVWNMAVELSQVTFPGVAGAPNTMYLVAGLYLLYLFMLEMINLAISFISLPVRLVSHWLEGVS